MITARTISNRLPRQIALVAIVAGFFAISGSSASAGVMFPWIENSVEGQASAGIDLTGDVTGTSSRVEIPVKSDQTPCERGDCPSRESQHVVDALGGSNGASAPASSASGQMSLLVAVAVQSPVVVQTPACASRHLRERSIQLPHPPLGELLDPPKV